MAEQLQGLLERIQKDGIEKADAEAERIIKEAGAKAAAIVNDTETKAQASLEQAERESKAFAERGEVALKQAARDVVISVGKAITRALEKVVSADVKNALSDEALAGLIAKVVETYAMSGSGTKRIDVLLSNDQQQQVRQHVVARFAEALKDGVTLTGDSSVVSGFRVAIVGDNIEHDFSEAAITDALCELLRPHIARIVRDALSSGSD